MRSDPLGARRDRGRATNVAAGTEVHDDRIIRPVGCEIELRPASFCVEVARVPTGSETGDARYIRRARDGLRDESEALIGAAIRRSLGTGGTTGRRKREERQREERDRMATHSNPVSSPYLTTPYDASAMAATTTSVTAIRRGLQS